ncbi:MAG: hypothetical protein J7K53_11335 [Bacteroidales bacterium]|nr:hypothetical protein [Bacteroidales bacterium]
MKNIFFKQLFPLFAFFYSIGFANMKKSFFDPDSLGGLSASSKSGGGSNSILQFIAKEDCEIVPTPDVDNPQYTSNDFVPKAGKQWIPIFTDNLKTNNKEEQGDNRFASAFISTCEFFIPGDNDFVRQAINEGVFVKEGYLLVTNCADMDTILFGKGKCFAGTFKISYESGMKSTDEKGWTFTFTVEQDGVNTKYKGVGSASQEYSIAVDDTTPDVSTGTGIYILHENTGANEITALDNAVQGSLITLKWNSTTNHSTITDGTTFQLAGAFTPATGAILVLQATTTGTFAERYRMIP